MDKKEKMYQDKYGQIPINYEDRLRWMCDKYKINENIASKIIEERQRRIDSMYYTIIKIVLYQIPEGAKRPRFRIINRKNVLNAAKINSSFIHVYSPGASQNNAYMKRVIDETEFLNIEQLICTPCDVEFRAYFPTPSYYNRIDTFMAEIGLDRPITKPDFDNIAKLYSDMYNSNVWLDDCLTIRGSVDKFYSILPRVEIDLRFLNGVYNKHQYNNIINRKDFTENMSLNII